MSHYFDSSQIEIEEGLDDDRFCQMIEDEEIKVRKVTHIPKNECRLD